MPQPTYHPPHLAPFTDPGAQSVAPQIVITRGEGNHVYDVAGKRYLDGLAGLWSNSLGCGGQYGDRLADAAHRQMKQLPYMHCFWNRTTDVVEAYR